MFKRSFQLLLVLLFILSLSVGCANQKKKQAATDDQISSVVGDAKDEIASYDLNANSDSGTAGALRTVNFAFNSAAISSTARDILDANADILQTVKFLKIQVEGHCDERGGVQYNLALGERRAKAIKDYLIATGITSNRITTVSFGKERPIAYDHSEEAWGQNRRANFVITANK